VFAEPSSSFLANPGGLRTAIARTRLGSDNLTVVSKSGTACSPEPLWSSIFIVRARSPDTASCTRNLRLDPTCRLLVSLAPSPAG
jgi:hypothetical protein